MTTSTLAAGPEALGLRLGAEATVTDDGWLVREMHAAPGLDGPPGILQGGVAVGVAIDAARLADRFGAPVTSVGARLRAPTPVGRDLQLRVRPTDAARYEVETRDGQRLLVAAEVELAGQDPTPQVFDLAELARVPLPEPEPQEWFGSCWVCGADPSHANAQRLYPGWHDDRTVVTPWVADEALGDERGVVDPLVVAAVLDCPTVWASWSHVRARGDTGALLGGYHLRFFRDAPVMAALRTVGRCDEVDGRKIHARGALLDEDGVVYAASSAFQISVAEVPTVD
jgi:acyl-coenzyme A thioesterase PaaI-like protein